MERRDFITKTGTGIAAAGMLGGFTASASKIIQLPIDKSINDVISIKLPPLEQPTEKEQAVSSVSLPKDKRIGYAIVGLGNLSLGQILPAFGTSKYAKPVALVSRCEKDSTVAHTLYEQQKPVEQENNENN